MGCFHARRPFSSLCASTLPILGLASAPLAHGQVNYSVTDLGAGNNVAGINNAGQVVGNNAIGPFVWSAGSGLVGLGPLPQDSDPNLSGGTIVLGSASSINDNQNVAGTLFTNNGLTEPFLWTANGGYQLLAPGTRNGEAAALNNSGDVVGASGNGAIKWLAPGVPQSLAVPVWNSFATSVNDTGYAVGYLVFDQRAQGLLWSPSGVPADLPNLGANIFQTVPTAINNNNQVVGYDNVPTGGVHAFSYANGNIADLGTLGGTSSRAISVNNNGAIVGNANLAGDGTTHAFVYQNGAMKDLNSMLDNSGSGWTLAGATGVNNLGQIVGSGTNAGGQTHAFLLTPHLVTTPVTTVPGSQFTNPPTSNLGSLQVFDSATGQFDLGTSAIEQNEPTIVITHGWNDNPSSWGTFASQIHSDASFPVNIVAWNWSTAASGAYAPWIAGRTPIQGIALATALSSALGGAAYDNPIQFIGHSLGTLVNAQAINQFRIYDPDDLKIQDTLFDDAEVAAVGTIRAVPSVPVAWIDNYISAFGNIHPEAANVILQGGPTDLLPVNFHSYPQDWYEQTMGTTFSPQFGFQSSITQGGLNGNEPPTGSYYIQNGNGNNLTPVFLGEAGAQTVLGVRDAVEGFTIAPSAIGYFLANDITAPIQTYNQCQVAITSNGSFQLTLGKRPNSIFSSSVKTSVKVASSPASATDAADSSSSSSYAWVPITIPTDAQYLSLDFICSGLSPTDFFSLGIDDTPLFEAENQFVTDGIATNTGFIDVSQWSGQQAQLFVGLNAGDDNNIGGTIIVDNVEFASVPEPASFCQVAIVGLLIRASRRRRTTCRAS